MDARRARILLLVCLVPLAAYVAWGDRPWELPGGPSFAAERGASLFVTAKIALWWTSAVNAALVLLLAATAPLWTAPAEPAPAGRGGLAASPAPAGRAFWLGLLLLALLATGLRANLYAGGLFWDEVWTLHRAVNGHFEVEPETGRLVYEEVPWRKTFWAYEKPTNHILVSVAGRVANDVWQRATGRGPEAFDVRVLRLPSLLACALSVVLLGLLVRQWGAPRAALLAAFLLAVHPWHVRHGPTLRGYAFVVLGSAAALWCLVHVLREGRWRWLAGYAAGVVLVFWTHPFGLYLVAALGACALATLMVQGRPRLAARFFAANLLAGMFLLQVMGPALAQLPLWENVHDVSEGALVRPGMLRELWSQAASGIPQRVPESTPEVPYPSVADGPPLRRAVVWGALPLLFCLGLAAALRRPGPQRPAVAGLVLGVPLAIAGALVQGHSFYERFAIYFVLATCGLFAVGWGALAAWAARGRRPAEVALLVLGGALFVALASPQERILLEREQSGMRAAVAWLDSAPGADVAMKAGLGLGGDNAKVYDPTLLYFERPAELRSLVEEARHRGVPLYVYYAYEHHNRRRQPRTFDLLDTPGAFETLATFPGVEPAFTYHILRPIHFGDGPTS